jgi:uncharacterized membrane protein YfcA
MSESSVTGGVFGLATAAAAAAVAGAINSAAGGGSFISFPTLVFLGVPPITANATNTAAMWLGGLGTIRGFREDMTRPTRRFVAAMAASVVGGVAGAVLLLHTPPHAFNAIIPWLLLFATVAFAISPAILKLTNHPGGAHDLTWWSVVPLFCVAVYGGFFGGGQGLVLLAYFALIGMTDLRRMNALKAVLSFINNGVPVIPFVIARALAWDVAAAMCVGAAFGGYYGARLVRRVPPRTMRWAIVVVGAATSAAFFFRAL